MSVPRLSSKEEEVLRLLAEKPEMYGLEMVTSSTQLKRGTVYPTLGRMAEKGYVSSREEDLQPGEGPPRRLYCATELGMRAYRAAQAAAQAFHNAAEDSQ